MANWRDKNKNAVLSIGAGSAPQVTGIVANQQVTLANGDTTIVIPAGALEVGDSLRVKGMCSSAFTAGTWLLYLTADLTEATYMMRHAMTTAANQSTVFDLLFAVTDATTLTSKLYNGLYGEGNANSAPSTHVIDITNDIELEFFLFANASSGTNTFDLLNYEVEIIKAH